MPDEIDLSAGLLPEPRKPRRGGISRDRILQIARSDNIPDDIADDFAKVMNFESGGSHFDRRGKVKLSPPDPKTGERAVGAVQIKPSTARGVGVDDPFDEEKNLLAGLRYFRAGGDDPTARRIHYFGGPRPAQQYRRTGRIPKGRDVLGTTFEKYVQSTGGQQKQKPKIDLSAGFEDDDLAVGLEDSEQILPAKRQSGIKRQNPPVSANQSKAQSAPSTSPFSRMARQAAQVGQRPSQPIGGAGELRRLDEPEVKRVLAQQEQEKRLTPALSRYGVPQQEIQRIARAQADRSPEEVAREQRVAQAPVSELIKQVPKSVALGAAESAATGLKSLGVLAKKINLFGDTTDRQASDLATYQAGEYISKRAREILQSNPDLEQDFIVGKAPQAIGQAVSFLLGGLATKAPKLTVTILGAGMSGGSAYDEVIAAGGTDDEAVNAGLLSGAILGPTELIGMRGAMKAIAGTAQEATLKAALKTALREGRRDVIENAIQEAGQEFGQGLITGQRRTPGQLAEAAGLGAIASGVVTPTITLANQVGGRRARQASEIEAQDRAAGAPTPDTGSAVQSGAIPEARDIPAAPERGDSSGLPTVEQPQRFYHKDWGEVEVLADQTGAGRNKYRIAEVANPERQHYVKKSDLRGRGNERMVPVKQAPSPPLTLETIQRDALSNPEFREVLALESVGGNAGPSRAAVNMMVDKTGRVAAIGNLGSLPAEVEEAYRAGTLVNVAAIVKYEAGMTSPRVESITEPRSGVAGPPGNLTSKWSIFRDEGNKWALEIGGKKIGTFDSFAEANQRHEEIEAGAEAAQPVRAETTASTPKTRLVDQVADLVDPQTGGLTRGGDYVNGLMKNRSEAELRELLEWTRQHSSEFVKRFVGGNVDAELRSREPTTEEVDATLADLEKPAFQRRLEARAKDPAYRRQLEGLGLTADEIRIHLTPRSQLNDVERAIKREVHQRVIGSHLANVERAVSDIVEGTLNTATRFRQQEAPAAEALRSAPSPKVESQPKKKKGAAERTAYGQSTKASLAQFIRRSGGITPTEMYRGELDRLRTREMGKTGAFLVGSRKQGGVEQSADIVMQMANDAGYRDPQTGQPFENPGDFLRAVESDASGTQKIYVRTGAEDFSAAEAEYYAEQEVRVRAEEARDNFLEAGRGAELFDKVRDGKASDAERSELTQLASEVGITKSELEDTLTGARAEIEGLEEVRSEGPPTQARPAEQLGFVQEGLTQESAPPKLPDQRARLASPASLDPARTEAHAKLAELKRRGLTIDDYARQPDLEGNVPSAEEVTQLRTLESGKQASIPDQPQLPELKDNYRKPLKEYSNRLYREVSANGALDMLPTTRRMTDVGDVYLSNTPDLALGQGSNKGILLEFESGDLEGQVNRSKPGWEPLYKQGQAEFIARLNKQGQYQKALTSVTVKRDAKMSRVERMQIDRALVEMEEAGWTKTTNPDGSSTYQKPAPAQNFGPGTMRAGEPLPEVKERKFGKRFVEDERIADEIRSEIGTAKYYEPIPNKITAEQAKKLVDERGIGESVRIVRDEKNDLSPHIRATMGQTVILKLNQTYRNLKAAGSDKADGVLEQAVDLAEWAMDYGTRLGQGVQSFAMWARLTPEGKLLQYKRFVKKARERHQKMFGEDVAEIVNTVNKDMTDAERAEALKNLFNTNKTAKKVKTDFDKILEAAKSGKLTDTLFYEIVGDKLGLPGYNRETAQKITDLANQIEAAPEGLPRTKLVLELQKFIAEQKGFDVADLPLGIFYGNILSGYNTHAVNFADTGLNVLSEINGLALNNPQAAAKIYAGMLRGFAEGRWDAMLALTEGRMFRDSKWLDAPGLMEVAKFGQKGGVPIKTETRTGRLAKRAAESKIAIPLNAYKYVSRAMSASDAVMARSAGEARATLLAYKMAKEEGLKGDALEARVREILALDRASDFEAQAKREGVTGKEAAFRAHELREMARPKDLTADAAEFAGEATYNHTPHGTLGLIAERVGKLADDVKPLKLFVPFTRIVANVTNRGLNYTPYGYKRAVAGWGFGKNAEPLTAEERRLMLTRATMGTAGMVLLGVLQEAGVIAIHGNGPSDREKRRQLQNAGWRPYSLQIGKTYISYVYSPVGLGLSIIGNMKDSTRYHELEQKDAATRGAYAVARLGSTIFSQSFLSGLSRLFGALSEEPSKSVASVKQTLGGTVAAFGVPNIARDVHRLFDNKAYQSTTLGEDLIRNTPFAALALRPTLNAFGEPVKLQRQRFFDIQTSDPAWKFVIEKNLRVPVPGRTIEIAKGRRITPEEYHDLLKTTGPKVKDWIIKNRTRLSKMKEQDAQDELSEAATRIRKFELVKMKMKVKKKAA